jgi:hypothetical protein
MWTGSGSHELPYFELATGAFLMNPCMLTTVSLAWVVASLCCSARAAADDLFPDKNLEAAVRKYVFEKRDKTDPLTAEDVRDISTIESKGKKDDQEKKIRDLSGLDKCVSLALLDLENHEISDVTPLKDLKRLQSLNLAKNKIKDITPLATVSALQYLQLEDNEISSIEPVAKLEKLNSLYLSRNKIEDISHVVGLKKLWSLYLGGNQIADVKPLSDLKWLSSLDLKNNKLTDISPLAGLTELKYLFLEGNQVADLKTLVEMAQKDAAGDTRFAPFWRIYLAGNPLSDEAKTAQVEELKKLGGRITLEEKSEKKE